MSEKQQVRPPQRSKRVRHHKIEVVDGVKLVQPVSNAALILRHLSSKPDGANISGIAQATGLHLSNCFNLLKTLTAIGWVAFGAETKTYRLGLGILQIARSVLTQDGSVTLVTPLFQDLAQKFDVTLTLWKLSPQDRSLLVTSAPSNAAVQIHMPVGQRISLFNGAFGRVYAFHHGLTKSEVTSALKATEFVKRPNPASYWKEVQDVARLGWALDDENYALGVLSIAVPVFDGAARMTHGITATMFKGQLKAGQQKTLADSMLLLAEQLRGALPPG